MLTSTVSYAHKGYTLDNKCRNPGFPQREPPLTLLCRWRGGWGCLEARSEPQAGAYWDFHSLDIYSLYTARQGLNWHSHNTPLCTLLSHIAGRSNAPRYRARTKSDSIVYIDTRLIVLRSYSYPIPRRTGAVARTGLERRTLSAAGQRLSRLITHMCESACDQQSESFASERGKCWEW